MRVTIPEDYVITLYDADKKKVIGIFKNVGLTGTYLYKGCAVEGRYGRVMHRVRSKTRVMNSPRLAIPIAVRYATPAQREQLGDKPCWVAEGYPPLEPYEISRYSDFCKK